MIKPKIGDLFLYLIRLLASDENWHVALRGRSEIKVRDEFYAALKKHSEAFSNEINVPVIGDLDSHKQAAIICLAVLDVYPLSNLSEPVTKKAEFYFPNEFIAMKMGRYHVRLSLSDADPLKPDSLINLYKNSLVHDTRPYDNNFIYMLSKIKQLNGAYNYVALSTLFYHFERDLKQEDEKV